MSIFTKMKKALIYLILLTGLHASSQQCICKYYQYEYWEDEAVDTFSFKNGEKLKICPSIWHNFDNDQNKYFQDFALEQCENDSIVFVGKSYTYHRAELKSDTLVLEEVIDLAVGKDRKMERVILSANRIYLQDGKFRIKQSLNSFRKYSPEEIAATVKEYENKRRISIRQLLLLSSRLFIAALSDEKAKKYFLDMQPRYRDEPLEYHQDLVELFREIQLRQ